MLSFFFFTIQKFISDNVCEVVFCSQSKNKNVVRSSGENEHAQSLCHGGAYIKDVVQH